MERLVTVRFGEGYVVLDGSRNGLAVGEVLDEPEDVVAEPHRALLVLQRVEEGSDGLERIPMRALFLE